MPSLPAEFHSHRQSILNSIILVGHRLDAQVSSFTSLICKGPGHVQRRKPRIIRVSSRQAAFSSRHNSSPTTAKLGASSFANLSQTSLLQTVCPSMPTDCGACFNPGCVILAKCQNILLARRNFNPEYTHHLLFYIASTGLLLKGAVVPPAIHIARININHLSPARSEKTSISPRLPPRMYPVVRKRRLEAIKGFMTKYID